MTVRLARQWYWNSMVISDRYDRPVINPYSLKIEFATDTQDNHEHNIAYGRMKFWFQEVMESSVLISQDHPKLKNWQDLQDRVLVFPEDPVDQLVGMMIYTKLQAITQGRVVIDQVSVSSPLDDEITYHHYGEESLGPFEDAGWWSDPRPVWQHRPQRARGKVISLDRAPDWRDHELDWDPSNNENVLMITPTTPHENQ